MPYQILIFIFYLLITGCGTTLISKSSHTEIDQAIKALVISAIPEGKTRYIVCGGVNTNKTVFVDRDSGKKYERPTGNLVDMVSKNLDFGPLKIESEKFGAQEINLDESMIIDTSEEVWISVSTNYVNLEKKTLPIKFSTQANPAKSYLVQVDLVTAWDSGEVVWMNNLPTGSTAQVIQSRLEYSVDMTASKNCKNKRIVAYLHN